MARKAQARIDQVAGLLVLKKQCMLQVVSSRSDFISTHRRRSEREAGIEECSIRCQRVTTDNDVRLPHPRLLYDILKGYLYSIVFETNPSMLCTRSHDRRNASIFPVTAPFTEQTLLVLPSARPSPCAPPSAPAPRPSSNHRR